MKKKSILSLILLLNIACYSQLSEQFNISFSPDISNAKDAIVWKKNDNGIIENSVFWQTDLNISSINLNSEKIRSLIYFNALSTIPQGSVIYEAKLKLYRIGSSTINSDFGNMNFTVRRLVSYWSDTTTTWNNQPIGTTDGEIIVQPEFLSNEIILDVTYLVNQMVGENSQLYGFGFQLQDENIDGAINLGSAENTNELVRPVLELRLATPCVWAAKIGYTAYGWKFSEIKQAQDANVSERVTGGGSGTNANFGSHIELNPTTWTWNNNPGRVRSYIEFFPLSAELRNDLRFGNQRKILQARLFLYGVTSSNFTPQGNCRSCANNAWTDTDNSTVIERVLSSWNENTITWNNAPGTTSTNRSDIMRSQSTFNWNPESIDITALLQSMQMNPNSSYGFRISMLNETANNDNGNRRSVVFAGIDHPNRALNPRIEIVWANSPVTEQTIILQPNSTDGVDAQVIEYRVGGNNSNFGNSSLLTVGAWRSGSGSNYQHAFERNFINFNLSSLPTNSFLTGAELSLFATGTTSNNGNTSSWVQRVTSIWQENSITWANQPPTTESNRVWLPGHNSNNYSIINLNVTKIYHDILKSGSNNGIMIKLNDERWASGATGNSPNRWMGFASSDFSDASKRPRLILKYVTPCFPVSYSKAEEITQIQDIIQKDIITKNHLIEIEAKKIETEIKLKVYPNPISNQKVFISYVVSNDSQVVIQIYDSKGSLIETMENSFNKVGSYSKLYNFKTAKEKGIYFMQFLIGGKTFIKKVIIE